MVTSAADLGDLQTKPNQIMHINPYMIYLFENAKNQVSIFYTMVRTHFPNDCEWCYEVLGVTNGHYISQIDGNLLVDRI